MTAGCYRGMKCMCGGAGTFCMDKNVVYEAICTTCENTGGEGTIFRYIGETARQSGTRALEHMTNARLFKKESFIVDHWLENHPLETEPPVFKFKNLSKHGDPLSRQVREAVCIREMGNLNRRNEFSGNELIKLQTSCYAWDEGMTDKKLKKEKEIKDTNLKSFIDVM